MVSGGRKREGLATGCCLCCKRRESSLVFNGCLEGHWLTVLVLWWMSIHSTNCPFFCSGTANTNSNKPPTGPTIWPLLMWPQSGGTWAQISLSKQATVVNQHNMKAEAKLHKLQPTAVRDPESSTKFHSTWRDNVQHEQSHRSAFVLSQCTKFHSTRRDNVQHEQSHRSTFVLSQCT